MALHPFQTGMDNRLVTEIFHPKDLATDVDSKQLGIFGAANLQLLDPLKLVLGSRLSYWERDNGPENKQKENGVFTPYAGLIYDINHYLSAYASYTSIFNPSSRKDIDNNYLDPEQGNTSEFGLKSEFYDGLRIPVWLILSQKWIPRGWWYSSRWLDLLCSSQRHENQRLELTVAGEILPNWNIQAGYTYTDAKDNNGIRLNAAEILNNYSNYLPVIKLIN
jgi:outer membrane receptor for ferric coprogen and ferric-rhodotorulic acid